MKRARHHRYLSAWVLLCCILFSALHCAYGAGQMVFPGHGAADQHAHHSDGHSDSEADAHHHSSAAGGCEFASPFSAIILAAFFGLLAMLAPAAASPFAAWSAAHHPRLRWPPTNPRAPPSTSCC
ncbi:DUF2946 family protein [Halopseudomonas pertucinogena]|uniref:DUF2946 family protein n=1 Tax=Halopseudomonas pertucinogena TaxID=86175 RepID=UPI00166B667F